jgi:hypothetical protein
MATLLILYDAMLTANKPAREYIPKELPVSGAVGATTSAIVTSEVTAPPESVFCASRCLFQENFVCAEFFQRINLRAVVLFVSRNPCVSDFHVN